MVAVCGIAEHSLAKSAGIRAGDLLRSVNGNEIHDVLDYRFYMTDRDVHLCFSRDGSDYSVHFCKEEYEDVGLEFETPLMDKKHCCANRCVFCFIDQLPKGMRETLYFKDDDDRLSFLHGNYVTLTNLNDADVERLITMHLSPVNVSVHTTNPELRVKMMKNKRAGEVLAYLKRLAHAGISLCTQIVLCKGLNDKEELRRTMNDLLAYYPALKSCSVVPVGLTKYREGLYPLESFTPEDCREVLKQVTAFGDFCKEKYGTRLFYCSDEFYLRAGLPLPEDAFYEDYSQLENGVGMLTSLQAEFDCELRFLEDLLPNFHAPRTVSVVTGVAAYPTISSLAKRLENAVPGLTVHVYRIVNHFFGESVTVAGLLTAKDVAEQLNGKELGEEVLFPSVMLKADEEIFLDDKSPKDLEKSFGVRFTPTRSDGAEFISALLGISR